MGKTKFLRYAFMALTFAACLTGCSDDPQDDAQNFPQGGGEPAEGILLDLNVTVPGIESAVTRSLGEKDESRVNTLNVLVFGRTGSEKSDEDPFLYHVTPRSSGSSDSSDSSGSSYQVTLKQSDTPVYLVLIANARQVVTGKLSEMTGQNKGQVLSMLTFDTSQPWPQSGDARYLPMWGESAATTITSGTSTNALGRISLLRAVARIDVGANFTNQSDIASGEFASGNKFEISEVVVYNTQSLSRIAPESDHYTIEDGKLKATLPSLAGGSEVNSPQNYSQDPAPAIIRTVYTGEALNNSNQTNAQAGGQINAGDVCIVVGGYFTPNGGSKSAKTFYRINLKNKDASGNATEYYDLLRNYRYKINITNIYGEGFPTADEAYKAGPVNIETDMVTWNEGSNVDVSYDGQYQLAASTREMTFYREPHAQELKITATHPQGWKIVKEDGSAWNNTESWITVSKTSGNANTPESPETITVDVKQYDGNGETPREGSFWIQAGNLRTRIDVVQLPEVEMSIELLATDESGEEITELVFRKSATKAQTIRVKFFPKAMNNGSSSQSIMPKAVKTDMGSGTKIAWTRGDAPEGEGNVKGFFYPIETKTRAGENEENTLTYGFWPAARTDANPTELLTSTVTIYIEDPVTKRVESKTLTIRQLVSDLMLLLDERAKQKFPAKGMTDQQGDLVFGARADVAWKLEPVKNEGLESIVASYDGTEHKASGDYTDYRFKLHANDSWTERKIAFQPISVTNNPEFDDTPIEITQEGAKPAFELYYGEGIKDADGSKTQGEKIVADATIDLGDKADPSAFKIDVKGNAVMTYDRTKGDNAWKWIISGTSPSSTSPFGSNTFTDTWAQNQLITVTPHTITRENNNTKDNGSGLTQAPAPAAGEVKTATLTFKYHEDAKVPEAYQSAEQNLYVKRTVPTFFDNFAFEGKSPDEKTLMLDKSAKQFSVQANTNASFQVTGNNGLNTKTIEASPYGSKTLRFDVTSTQGSWSPVNYTLTASYKAKDADKWTEFAGKLTVTRSGYSMNGYVSNWPQSKYFDIFSSAKYTVTAKLSGDYPANLPLRLYSQSEKRALVSTNAEGNGTQDVTMEVTRSMSESFGDAIDVLPQYQQAEDNNTSSAPWVTMPSANGETKPADVRKIPRWYIPEVECYLSSSSNGEKDPNQTLTAWWKPFSENKQLPFVKLSPIGDYTYYPGIQFDLYYSYTRNDTSTSSDGDGKRGRRWISKRYATPKGTFQTSGQEQFVKLASELAQNDWNMNIPESEKDILMNYAYPRDLYVVMSYSGIQTQVVGRWRQEGRALHYNCPTYQDADPNKVLYKGVDFYVASQLAKNAAGQVCMSVTEAMGVPNEKSLELWTNSELLKGMYGQMQKFAYKVPKYLQTNGRNVCENYEEFPGDPMKGKWRLPTTSEAVFINTLCTECVSGDATTSHNGDYQNDKITTKAANTEINNERGINYFHTAQEANHPRNIRMLADGLWYERGQVAVAIVWHQSSYRERYSFSNANAQKQEIYVRCVLDKHWVDGN